MPLRSHDFPLYDEERYNLHAGLEDFWYARDFLRRIGKEERRRFSERGWYYGDPGYYGGSVVEIYDLQLSVILYSLFGDALASELFDHYVDHDRPEDAVEREMIARDGGPVVPTASRFSPDEPEELLIAEIRGERRRVEELEYLVRLSEGESPRTRFYRWAAHSERADLLADREHLLLLFGSELYAPQELVRDGLFERLIRAWEARNRG